MPKMSTGGKRKGRRTGKKGGNCQSTGAIGTSVYGAGNEQHAQAGSGNAIAYNGGDAKYQAGNAFTDVAVPAALLYANHRYSRGKVAYGRRSQASKKRFGKNKQRKTKRRSYRRR